MRSETFVFDDRRRIVVRHVRRPHPLPNAPDKLGTVKHRYMSLDGVVVTVIQWEHRKKPIAYHGIGSINRIEVGSTVRCRPNGLIFKEPDQ